MTGARRPNNILPPIPNPGDEEGAEEEEEEDSDGSSNGGGSDTSGTTTPLSREIRTYEERNRELANRLREFEQERLHQVNIQEEWKNAVITLEAKLVEMRAKVEVVEKEGAAALGRDVGFTAEDLATIAGIEKEVEHLQALINANEGFEVEQRPEANGEGSNLDETNQMSNARTGEN